MSEAGETIKNLYQKFVMRDILSFITPGAIFVMCCLYLYGWDLSKIIRISKEIHFILYLPIFGVFYVLGLSFQFVGTAKSEFIRIHNRTSWNEHLCYLKEFYNVTRNDEEAKNQHERFVVLKQACGNNCVALVFSGLLVLVKLFYVSQATWTSLVLLLSFLLVIVAYLYKAHERNLIQQEAWENLYIEESHARVQLK